MPDDASFSGFPRETPRFLRDLARNNNKHWFDTHRADYERCYVAPAKRFVVAVGHGLRRLSKNIRGEPRVGGSIMRINRDLRFSKDKTRYKTGLHVLFPEGTGPPRECPAFYFRLDATSAGFAAGLFAFTPPQLASYRSALTDTRTARTLMMAVQKLTADGFELGGARYKRVPSGFDADAAHAPLLLHAGLHLGFTETLPDALFTPGAVDYCLARFKRMQPVQRWLVDTLS